MDLRNYPFDVQYLELPIKLRSSDGNTWHSSSDKLGKNVYPEFSDPVTWRQKGHILARMQTGLGSGTLKKVLAVASLVDRL